MLNAKGDSMAYKLVFAVMAAGLAGFGQQRGVGHAPAPPPVRGIGIGSVGHGFGNVVFPGTGIPRTGPSFPQQLGATVRGGFIPGYHGVNRGGAIPVAVPVFVGGYGYAAPAPPPPQNITIFNQPPMVPSVIINQNYVPDRANPVMRDYTKADLPEAAEPSMRVYQAPIPSFPDPPKKAAASDKPTIYLIAFQDGTIYPALAFWVEGETLHYITTKHSHNKASIDLADIALSRQLNQERGVEFNLKGVE
ncbi:MAG: hypothetical protein FJW20_02080 [Acidimicrobiia bacterium]|nr:hypothetical protein [Acidimicrobiia bacterium]